MAITIVLLSTIFLTLCSYIFLQICRHVTYFKRRNIPTPALPSFFYGHMKTLWSSGSFSEQLRQWTEMLGPIYGIFEGTKPVYVVSDPAFIEEVFVTQFSNFHTKRGGLPFLNTILGNKRVNLGAANGNRWKHQREALNPAFTSSKLRSLVPIMEGCIELFMKKLDEKQKDENSIETDIYPSFKNLTMDVIGRTAFGVELGTQNDESNAFMEKVNQIITENFERSTLAKLSRLFPSIGPIWAALYQLQCKVNPQNISASVWLANNVFGLVQERVEGRKISKRTDLLQLMIDASQSEKHHLTQSELLSNVFAILLAGFGTTSATLSNCVYVLATHQDIQDNLYKEILNSSNEIEDESTTTKMTYMDMFIREVLRMYPVVTQVLRRECVEDTFVIGYKINKGSLVQVDVLSVHFNEDLWGPLPVDEFHPERHETERHPMSFLAFGAGPHTCIGAQFALMETKLALVRLLTNYRIMPASTKTTELNRQEFVACLPTNTWIKLEKR